MSNLIPAKITDTPYQLPKGTDRIDTGPGVISKNAQTTHSYLTDLDGKLDLTSVLTDRLKGRFDKVNARLVIQADQPIPDITEGPVVWIKPSAVGSPASIKVTTDGKVWESISTGGGSGGVTEGPRGPKGDKGDPGRDGGAFLWTPKLYGDFTATGPIVCSPLADGGGSAMTWIGLIRRAAYDMTVPAKKSTNITKWAGGFTDHFVPSAGTRGIGFGRNDDGQTFSFNVNEDGTISIWSPNELKITTGMALQVSAQWKTDYVFTYSMV